METTIIEIKGDITTKIVENRQKKSDGTEIVNQSRSSVKTEDWFNAIKMELTPPFEYVVPAMPVGSRIAAMAKTGDKSVYVVEMSPTIMELRVNFGEGGDRLYRLSFPFVIFVQRFVGQELNGAPFIYYRSEPIVDESNYLFEPNLPNINSNYSVCWGSGGKIGSSQPTNVKLAQICHNFWQSQFNSDLSDNFWEPSKKMDGHPQNMSEWEEMTGNDPSFILKINWRSVGKTVADILKWGVK